MAETIKYCIMLKIIQGNSDRLPFSLDSLKSDIVVAIIDEVHNVLWLWMGANTGLVQRRGAMRVAQSLKTYGHTIGPTIVGRNSDDVISVDEKKIQTDSLMGGRYEKVQSLFQMDFSIDADVLAVFKTTSLDSQPSYYGLSKGQRDNLVEAAISAPSVGDDQRNIEEVIGQYRPSPTFQESSTPESTVKTVVKPTDVLIGDVKASIVISSILTQLNDIFVGVSDDPSGKKIYTIENADGVICKFSIDGTNIKFLPGSWDKIDKNSMMLIQKVFIERTKILLKNL